MYAKETSCLNIKFQALIKRKNVVHPSRSIKLKLTNRLDKHHKFLSIPRKPQLLRAIVHRTNRSSINVIEHAALILIHMQRALRIPTLPNLMKARNIRNVRSRPKQRDKSVSIKEHTCQGILAFHKHSRNIRCSHFYHYGTHPRR